MQHTYAQERSGWLPALLGERGAGNIIQTWPPLINLDFSGFQVAASRKNLPSVQYFKG